MEKSTKHLDAANSLILMTKFNITVDELDKITEIGFEFNEKTGWFVKADDVGCPKDCLIIKAEGKEFKIETEEFIYDGDGCHYTDYSKTHPLQGQTLIEFLIWYYVTKNQG